MCECVCVCVDLHREALRGPDLRKPVEIIHHKKTRKKNEGGKNEGRKTRGEKFIGLEKDNEGEKHRQEKKRGGSWGDVARSLLLCVCPQLIQLIS